MADDSPNPVIQHLRLLLAAQTPAHVTDRDLLARFITRRDEAAFAALVHRYSPMVLGVCRRVLNNTHDADDACQATFLILVRKAAAIRNQDSLAGWLHRVARRTAEDLRARQARRATQPLPEEEIAARADRGGEPMWREVRAALDEELQRLPDCYRAPLILCYLDGRTRDEAAHQLGWSLDVFRGRLDRGREALRRRLVRRGLALSAGLMTAALTHAPTSARASVALVLGTIKYARMIAAGQGAGAGLPAPIAELILRGLQSMVVIKKKVALFFLLAACLAGTAGYAVYQNWPTTPEQAWAVSLTPEQVASVETVQLAGKVLTPDGKPAAGAELRLVSLDDSPLAEGPPLAVTKEDGTFAFPVPEGELARHLVVDRPIHLVAAADGFGLAWRSVVDFMPEAKRNWAGLSWGRRDATLRLTKDDAPLTGRIEDAAGRPAAGVTVRLEAVWTNEKNDLTEWLAAVGRDQQFEATNRLLPLTLRGKGLERFSATTDAEGRFRFTGIGAGRVACLKLSGPGVAAATVLARTQAGPRLDVADLANFIYPQPYGCCGADFSLAASPARPIVGVVRDQDTGRPVAGAVVQSQAFAGSPFQAITTLSTRTDAEGRYRIDGMPIGRGNMLLVRAPVDQPYLPAVAEIDTSEGDGPAMLDLKVRRGLWAEGQVTDVDTHRPMAADVDYFCFRSNPNVENTPGFDFARPILYQTDAAGRFRVPVLPGRGVLAVRLHGQEQHFLGGVPWVTQAGKGYRNCGLTLDAPEEVVGKGIMMYNTQPGLLSVLYYQHLALIAPKEDAESITCDLKVSSKPTSKPEAKP